MPKSFSVMKFRDRLLMTHGSGAQKIWLLAGTTTRREKHDRRIDEIGTLTERRFAIGWIGYQVLLKDERRLDTNSLLDIFVSPMFFLT
jgi:hypothetical protein